MEIKKIHCEWDKSGVIRKGEYLLGTVSQNNRLVKLWKTNDVIVTNQIPQILMVDWTEHIWHLQNIMLVQTKQTLIKQKI